MAGNWTVTSDSTTSNTKHTTADEALKAGRSRANAGVKGVTVTAPDGSKLSRR